jgi:hypothetical protein
MASTITPNMNLIVPTVGQEAGPQYAFDLNSSLTIIDQHNHAPGSGVQINPNGLDINSNLTFNNNAATALLATVFMPQTSLATLGAVYVSGSDLYYNDLAGNVIRLTASGSPAGGAGSITGLPSGTAGVAYAAGTFTFSEATNTPANIAAGSIMIGNNTALSKYLTLSAPAALASNYTITLPLLPSSQKIVTLDNTGLMSAPWTFDNSTIGVSSNTIEVLPGGITTTQIASGTILGSNIAASTITGSNIASNTVAPTNLTAKVVAQSSITSQVLTPGTHTIFSQTLTSTGRPVVAYMYGFSPSAFITSSASFTVDIRRDSTTIGGQNVQNSAGGSAIVTNTIFGIDNTPPPAGAHTWSVVLTNTQNVTITDWASVVYEL